MKAVAVHTDPLGRDTSLDPLWPAASRIVQFLHPECDFGPRILQSASEKLEKAMTAQAKRFYYRSRCLCLAGKTDQLRSKVFLSEPQLFQLLVYRESDQCEWLEEISSSRIFEEELLLIRFVKQLVQLTLPRNAFYVALAIAHFLSDYSGPETLMLYDSLFGSDRRTRDDSYSRARKSLLRGELTRRFGSHLILVQGPRGESHFLENRESAESRQLIVDCLNQFVPWGTPCLNLQPLRGFGSGYSVHESDSHWNELQRMHILLHPPCLELHCQRLGIASPLERLRVPSFFPKVSRSFRPNGFQSQLRN